MEISLSRRWGAWVALAVSLAIYATVSLLGHEPFRVGGLHLRYFDLRIYHLGALRLMHGTALYGAPMLKHLGFTYPPFAALVLAPLAWLPLGVDELAVTGLNVVLLVFLLRRALMLAPLGRAPQLSGARAWSLAAGLAAAALWLEPISVTIGYGQINLLIAALVLFDLSRPDAARTKGVAIGVAAAIKLTPLLFIPYLLLSRRRRSAAVAVATFGASVALSFVVTPGYAATYWFHAIFQTSRVGSPLGVANQSLHGVIARLTGTAQPGPGWDLLIVAIVLGGLALAIRASRRGDEAAGFSFAALSTLLASPISWSHHWTLAVPALVLLARRAYEQRSRALTAAAAVLAVAGYVYLPELAESHFRFVRGPASLLTGDPYPLLAIAVLSLCGASVAWACVPHTGLRLRVPSTQLVPAATDRAVAAGVR